MPLDAARLRKIADELDADERAEREASLERQVAELKANGGGSLSSEDRAELAALRERLAALEAADRTDPDVPPVVEPAVDPPKDPDPEAKTRPGRKSGAAYDWDVDENGDVVDLDVAQVFTGEDEPDEVELPA